MNSDRGAAAGFIVLAVASLWAGALFGVIGSWQHVIPGVIDLVPFVKSRPLHVSLVVAWIFMAAIGGIYYHLPRLVGAPLHSSLLAKLHLLLFVGTGLAIIGSYFMGRFGGREYWEFPPVLGMPIVLSWLLFMYNFFRTVARKKGPWPAYLWMWSTGLVFFLFTYLESNLWLFNWGGANVVRDLTIQWKAYGALTGSWNMLVYGTAMVLVERITRNTGVARSRLAYLLFALGFTNLLFGWAHHIYPVPSAPWLRILAYAVSMTEWLILARIIRQWRGTVDAAQRNAYSLPYRFLYASEVWVFINLALALLISIPAINLFSHGTHITVAHAMGSTIGINTMILFASVTYIAGEMRREALTVVKGGWTMGGFAVFNGALLLFFLCLIGAGMVKGWYTVMSDLPFQAIMQKVRPFLLGFAVAGVGLFGGISMLALRVFRLFLWKGTSPFTVRKIAAGAAVMPAGPHGVPEAASSDK
jgi:nitric oxide reductase subunit B